MVKVRSSKLNLGKLCVFYYFSCGRGKRKEAYLLLFESSISFGLILKVNYFEQLKIKQSVQCVCVVFF